MTMPRRRRSVAQAHLLDVLTGQLDAMIPGDPRPLDVVDLGGGTGGLAIDIAALGHRVTVIDPSPDALASLERRTAEAELPGEVVGRQGDASDLVAVVGRQAADVVVCHRVLEFVDSPAEALAAIAAVLRPGGGSACWPRRSMRWCSARPWPGTRARPGGPGPTPAASTTAR